MMRLFSLIGPGLQREQQQAVGVSAEGMKSEERLNVCVGMRKQVR